MRDDTLLRILKGDLLTYESTSHQWYGVALEDWSRLTDYRLNPYVQPKVLWGRESWEATMDLFEFYESASEDVKKWLLRASSNFLTPLRTRNLTEEDRIKKDLWE